MDIKITFDISDKLDSALSRIASAIQTVRATEKPDAPAEAEILPVETPAPVDVPKPAETAEVPAEEKADAPAEQKEESAAAELTLDEVRAICVKATKKGKTKVVTDFLGAHGAASLPKLDPKFYSELAAVVEAVL